MVSCPTGEVFNIVWEPSRLHGKTRIADTSSLAAGHDPGGKAFTYQWGPPSVGSSGANAPQMPSGSVIFSIAGQTPCCMRMQPDTGHIIGTCDIGGDSPSFQPTYSWNTTRHNGSEPLILYLVPTGTLIPLKTIYYLPSQMPLATSCHCRVIIS